MATDSLTDPWRELRELQRRLQALETASPLENSSISRNGLSVLTPTGPVVKVGHEGGKSGLLLMVGGSVLTVEEHIDARIATSHEYPANRIDDLEGRMTSAEAGVTYTANRTTDLEGRVGPLEGRMSTAEGGITYTANRVSDLEGRMGSAESSLGSKASQSQVNTIKAKQDDIIDALNNLEAYVRSQHPSKPLYPPIVKG